jgi:hypothetical protein
MSNRELERAEHYFRPPTEWKPEEAMRREAQAEAVKQYARATLDWRLLDDAVKQQIVDQEKLVLHWDAAVRGEGRPRKTRADRGAFSESDLERQTGIPHQKVSKWRKRLAGDRDEYEALLRAPSHRKAMAERGSCDMRGASGTGWNEWYTPKRYVDLARAVMGRRSHDLLHHGRGRPAAGMAWAGVAQPALFAVAHCRFCSQAVRGVAGRARARGNRLNE